MKEIRAFIEVQLAKHALHLEVFKYQTRLAGEYLESYHRALEKEDEMKAAGAPPALIIAQGHMAERLGDNHKMCTAQADNELELAHHAIAAAEEALKVHNLNT